MKNNEVKVIFEDNTDTKAYDNENEIRARD